MIFLFFVNSKRYELHSVTHLNKILIIKLRAIGDVVLSTIVIPNLRAAFPGAKIDFMTEPPARDVVAGNPDLNQVIVFDRMRIQRMGFWGGLKANLQFIAEIRKTRYDMVFDFFGNPRSAWLTVLSGSRKRIGYNWRGRKFAYNHVVISRAAEVHEAEFHLDALTALGIPIVSRDLNLPIPDSAQTFAENFFRENGLESGRVIGLNASGGWPAKKMAAGSLQCAG